MKLLAIPATLAALLLTLVVFAGGDGPPALVCGGGPTEVVLATIRTVESGGDYHAHATGSTASGAYQFLDSTWANYAGYTRAADAPPDIQDAKATTQVAAILTAHNNDVTAVPVVWYIGHVPPAGSSEWDTIPAPRAGNTLTPREYQQHWLGVYYTHLQSAPPTSASAIGAVPTNVTSTR